MNLVYETADRELKAIQPTSSSTCHVSKSLVQHKCVTLLVFLLTLIPAYGGSMLRYNLDGPIVEAQRNTSQLVIKGLDLFSVDTQQLNSASHMIHPVRNPATFTWEKHAEAVKGTKHRSCCLVKDRWACAGEEYRQVLLNTRPLDGSRYTFRWMGNNARILVEGNSYLAEVIASLICADPPDMVAWSRKVLEHNDMLAVYEQENVAVLMIDNDASWNSDTSRIIQLLHRTGYKPTHIVLGALNAGQRSPPRLKRVQAYLQAYPEVNLVMHDFHGIGKNCSSQNNDCQKDGPGHQCIPGPITYHAETFAEWLLAMQQ